LGASFLIFDHPLEGLKEDNTPLKQFNPDPLPRQQNFGKRGLSIAVYGTWKKWKSLELPFVC